MEQFLKSKGMKEKSIKTYMSVINRVKKGLGVKFTQEQLEDYLATLNLKPSSYNLYRAVMNFYTEKYLGYKITFSKAKKNNFLPIEVTREEFDNFLSVIPNKKHKLGFKLMYESGLRVSEVINLKKYDLNFEKLTVRIRGKGEKDRYSILPENISEELKDFTKGIEGNIFTNQNNGKKLTIKTFQERLKKAKLDSKITKDFTCHSLRHGFAINWVNDGLDIEILRRVLGHSSLKTTQIYLKCRTIDLTKIAKRVIKK